MSFDLKKTLKSTNIADFKKNTQDTMLKAYSLLKKCVKQSSMWFPTQAVHCVTAQVEAYPLVAGLFILNLVQGVVISHLVIIFKD